MISSRKRFPSTEFPTPESPEPLLTTKDRKRIKIDLTSNLVLGSKSRSALDHCGNAGLQKFVDCEPIKESDPTRSTGRADNTADMSTAIRNPSPPSLQESREYYWGLPSRPILIARSSSEEWTPKTHMEYRLQKEIDVVGSHPIADIWDDLLQSGLREALRGIHWTSIDVVRMGLERAIEDETMDKLTHGKSLHPVILWIGVEPASTEWQEGYERSLACRELVRKRGVLDVEVEIRESRVLRCAGPTLTRIREGGTCENRDLPYTQTLGNSVANPCQSIAGTLGFYLREKGTSRCFAVVNRHVVWHPESEDRLDYRYNNSSQSKIEMLQPATAHHEDAIRKNEYEIRHWSNVTTHQLHAHAALQKGRERQTFLRALEKDDDRIIGYVVASPALSKHPKLGFLRDWALVELDLTKYGGLPENIVWTIDIKDSILDEITTYQEGPYEATVGGPKALKLRDIVPMKDMKTPPMTQPNLDPVLYVAKRGITTNFTWGKASRIQSMVRHPFPDADEIESKEWCVQGFGAAFSKKGDSGAAVFDIMGRLGGIITGGVGLTNSLDTTFIIPIEWLLEDIVSFSGIEVDRL